MGVPVVVRNAHLPLASVAILHPRAEEVVRAPAPEPPSSAAEPVEVGGARHVVGLGAAVAQLGEAPVERQCTNFQKPIPSPEADNQGP